MQPQGQRPGGVNARRRPRTCSQSRAWGRVDAGASARLQTRRAACYLRAQQGVSSALACKVHDEGTHRCALSGPCVRGWTSCPCQTQCLCPPACAAARDTGTSGCVSPLALDPALARQPRACFVAPGLSRSVLSASSPAAGTGAPAGSSCSTPPTAQWAAREASAQAPCSASAPRRRTWCPSMAQGRRPKRVSA